MSKTLTPFERHLKAKISEFEMPYDQKSWYALEKSMGREVSGRNAWIVALVASVVVTAGGFFAWYQSQHATATASMASCTQRFEKNINISPVREIASSDGYKHASELFSSNQVGISNELPSTSASSQINGTDQNNNSTNNSSTLSQETTNQDLSPETSSSTSNDKNNTPKNADNLITFVSNVRQACEGTEVEFEATNAPMNADFGYLWNFGDGHFSNSPRPKHKYAKAGNYDVSLSVTSNVGKINTTVMNDMITINPAPDADFRWEFVNENPMKPEVRIVNTSEDAVTYEWTMSNGSTNDNQSPVIALDGNKKMVALSVRNDYGCEDGAIKHVSINSDFALNASDKYKVGSGVFMPQGLKTSKVNFVMSLYDESGIKVFETTNRQKGWDGSLPGGSKASAGQHYNWKVIITNDITQEQKYFNGTLTVSP